MKSGIPPSSALSPICGGSGCGVASGKDTGSGDEKVIFCSTCVRGASCGKEESLGKNLFRNCLRRKRAVFLAVAPLFFVSSAKKMKLYFFRSEERRVGKECRSRW